ncbi:hypothetical protein QBC37DRAFT_189655 [Rhypophila decipiens]|uniref:Uncharacterized protein n=1 Tax=Rhypophila decipiens TaxID=261697 RepID=A0AAN6YFW1_9PEZI|nr:hypothetical protein QBC37DRAFT_189655 [Rhypophila decipiens]
MRSFGSRWFIWPWMFCHSTLTIGLFVQRRYPQHIRAWAHVSLHLETLSERFLNVLRMCYGYSACPWPKTDSKCHADQLLPIESISLLSQRSSTETGRCSLYRQS